MVFRRVVGLLTLVIFLVALAGCGGGQKPAQEAGKPIKIVYWYSVGGKVAESNKKLVEQFNASHKDIQVEAVFQGSYDDAINKLKQSIQSKNTPNVMQVYDIGTRFMIDSKAIVPMQKWIDIDKVNLANFEPNILAYYTVDNKLYSMPFNTSTPILYYNKDMFKAAGLDPEKPPRTFEEVAAAAKKLTVREGDKVTRPGITIAIYGWFFEQFLAEQNAVYANNNNGRDAKATAVAFNGPQGEKVLSWWGEMVKDGSCGNVGRLTANSQKAFIAGQTAMTVDSTGVLLDILTGVGGKFEVGTAYMPRPTGADGGGVIIGGGSLWMLAGHTEAEEKAAWEFIKFCSDPKQQAFWHVNTGYFPITKLAYDEALLKEHHAKYPQLKIASDQLHSTPVTRATQGALLGVFTQARQEIEAAIELVLTGQASPQAALQKAAGTVNGAIERYNQTVQ